MAAAPIIGFPIAGGIGVPAGAFGFFQLGGAGAAAILAGPQGPAVQAAAAAVGIPLQPRAGDIYRAEGLSREDWIDREGRQGKLLALGRVLASVPSEFVDNIKGGVQGLSDMLAGAIDRTVYPSNILAIEQYKAFVGDVEPTIQLWDKMQDYVQELGKDKEVQDEAEMINKDSPEALHVPEFTREPNGDFGRPALFWEDAGRLHTDRPPDPMSVRDSGAGNTTVRTVDGELDAYMNPQDRYFMNAREALVAVRNRAVGSEMLPVI